jgi:hypothetical protein
MKLERKRRTADSGCTACFHRGEWRNTYMRTREGGDSGVRVVGSTCSKSCRKHEESECRYGGRGWVLEGGMPVGARCTRRGPGAEPASEAVAP